MDLKQLKYFVSVVESGGFHAAGHKLNITQPAVSTAVAKLEDGLGVKLFDRTGRHPKLTAEGEIYWQHAKVILAQIDTAYEDMKALVQLKRGIVRLGAPAMIATYILPEPILLFLSENKGIHVELLQMGGIDVEKQLVDGSIDLGFTGAERIDPKLDSTALFRRSTRACMSKPNPLSRKRKLTWNDIIDQPLAIFDRSYYLRAYMEDLASGRGHDLNVILETNVPAFLMAACEQTNVVSVLLEDAKKSNSQVVMKPIQHSDPVTISAMWSRNSSLSLASSALLVFLQSRRDLTM